MIVTSESTALTAISIDTRTGTPAREKLLTASEGGVSLLLANRPRTTKSNTGTTMEPNAPIGSRMKTLISIHVNFQSPRSIVFRSYSRME